MTATMYGVPLDYDWFAPGTAADRFWDFNTGGGHTSTARTADGTYAPLAGDFTGDGVDDILWYGSAADSLWDFNTRGGHSPRPVTTPVKAQPVAADLTGGGVDDVLWRRTSPAPDVTWFFSPPEP